MWKKAQIIQKTTYSKYEIIYVSLPKIIKERLCSLFLFTLNKRKYTLPHTHSHTHTHNEKYRPHYLHHLFQAFVIDQLIWENIFFSFIFVLVMVWLCLCSNKNILMTKFFHPKHTTLEAPVPQINIKSNIYDDTNGIPGNLMSCVSCLR